jgi:hypothetical protein
MESTTTGRAMSYQDPVIIEIARLLKIDRHKCTGFTLRVDMHDVVRLSIDTMPRASAPTESDVTSLANAAKQFQKVDPEA